MMRIERFKDRQRRDQELADEIDSHLAHEQDANLARGLSPAEARRRANVRFGNGRATREEVWRYRSLQWIEDVWRDLRFALRSLAKTPGFTVTAIVMITVGIGVNTAVFSVVNAVLLKPLTYPDPQSLVQPQNTTPGASNPFASIPEYNVLRQQTDIFQQGAAYDFGGAGLNLTGGDNPLQVQGVHVTANYLAMLGAPVIAGRTFTEAEDRPGGDRVVVLSYGLWMSRFGGQRDIVGRTIQIDSQPYLVIGIIGKSFVTDPVGDLWLPFQFDLTSQSMAHFFLTAGRMKPGLTLQRVNAQLKLVGDQFRRQYPGGRGPLDGFGAISLRESMIGDTRQPLLVLLGAVGLVLLIACANIASLVLVRASVRKRELATRAALGAGRIQILRQLMTESLVLSLTGGFLGLVLGFAGVRLLLAVSSPEGLPRVGENGEGLSLDPAVLLFTLGVSLLTGIVFGLVPAISASKPNLATSLNESSGRSGVGFRTGKTRSLLVITEMALALVLVIGAGLLIRTFTKLMAVDPGFNTHNVLTMAMSISGDRFQKTAGVAQLVHGGTEQLKAVPGVVDAAATCCLPLQGGFGVPFDCGTRKGQRTLNWRRRVLQYLIELLSLARHPPFERPHVHRAGQWSSPRRGDN